METKSPVGDRRVAENLGGQTAGGRIQESGGLDSPVPERSAASLVPIAGAIQLEERPNNPGEAIVLVSPI
jgi:hypothetical protein